MSRRNRYRYQPPVELTSQQLARLLHASRVLPRQDQKTLFREFGGSGSGAELDEMVSFARNDDEAVSAAARLDAQWQSNRRDGGVAAMSLDASQAVQFFVSSLISGEFGPDDSYYSRTESFLKNPHTVARTTEIFLERLLVDQDGKVLNHDEAERHARDYLDDRI